MEKERKGLFGRLLDFWKERFEAGLSDRIGFWNDTKDRENHFAEMGAVAVLSREDMKKTFWEEKAEKDRKEVGEKKDDRQETHIFFVPAEERKEKTGRQEAADVSEEEKRVTAFFATEFLQYEDREIEGEKETGIGKTFLWEMPEVERDVRAIIPVSEDVIKETTDITEEIKEIWSIEKSDREEKREEMNLDIEKLMQQMTKKLWEEREGCGRRLR